MLDEEFLEHIIRKLSFEAERADARIEYRNKCRNVARAALKLLRFIKLEEKLEAYKESLNREKDSNLDKK